MKRTVVSGLSAAFLASIIPLVGCDSGGDAGMPADTTPGVALDSMKSDMKTFKKEAAKKPTESAKTPSTPETKD